MEALVCIIILNYLSEAQDYCLYRSACSNSQLSYPKYLLESLHEESISTFCTEPADYLSHRNGSDVRVRRQVLVDANEECAKQIWGYSPGNFSRENKIDDLRKFFQEIW